MDYADIPPAPAIVRLTDTFAAHRAAMEKNERYPFWKARQERFQEKKAAMLRGMIPLVPAFILLKSAPLTIVAADGAASNTDASSYSFPGLNLNAADPLRWIAMAYMSSGAGPNAVNIDGTALGPIYVNVSGIWLGYVRAGTSGTLNLNMNATAQRITTRLFSIYGLLEATPLDTYAQSVATPHNYTVRVAAGGVLVHAARGSNANTLTTTSGPPAMTLADNSSQESAQWRVTGHAAFTADDPAYPISQSQSGGTIVASVASWAP